MLTFDASLSVLLRDYQINGLIAYLDQSPKFVEIYPMQTEAAISDGFEQVAHLLEPERRAERFRQGRLFNSDEQCRSQTIAKYEAELENVIAR
jgi:rubrerythrin